MLGHEFRSTNRKDTSKHLHRKRYPNSLSQCGKPYSQKSRLAQAKSKLDPGLERRGTPPGRVLWITPRIHYVWDITGAQRTYLAPLPRLITLLFRCTIWTTDLPCNKTSPCKIFGNTWTSTTPSDKIATKMKLLMCQTSRDDDSSVETALLRVDNNDPMAEQMWGSQRKNSTECVRANNNLAIDLPIESISSENWLDLPTMGELQVMKPEQHRRPKKKRGKLTPLSQKRMIDCSYDDYIKSSWKTGWPTMGESWYAQPRN